MPRQTRSRGLPDIDLDELLHGAPTEEQVKEYFRIGEFHDEAYFVEAIKKHLRTPEQKAALDQADVSIEEILNGRVGAQHSQLTQSLFTAWNAKLGFRHFGF